MRFAKLGMVSSASNYQPIATDVQIDETMLHIVLADGRALDVSLEDCLF